MKRQLCEETINDAFRWRMGSFFLWAAILLSFGLYVLPGFLGALQKPDITLIARIILGLFVMQANKILTFSHFRPSASISDEFKRFFTSLNSLHALLLIKMISYPILLRDINMYFRIEKRGVDIWITIFAFTMGLTSIVFYLVRKEYAISWDFMHSGRIRFFQRHIYKLTMPMAIAPIVSFVVACFYCRLLKVPIQASYGDYVNWELAGGFLILLDKFMTIMAQSFLARPPNLQDVNQVGEQLAVNGLYSQDPYVLYHSLADTLCAIADDERRAHLLAPETNQWSMITTYCSERLKNLALFCQSRSKVRPQLLSGSQLIDGFNSIFQDSDETLWRRRLHEKLDLAELSAKILVDIIVESQGTQEYKIIEHDSTVKSTNIAISQAIAEIDRLCSDDPFLRLERYKETFENENLRLKPILGESI